MSVFGVYGSLVGVPINPSVLIEHVCGYAGTMRRDSACGSAIHSVFSG